MRTDLTLRLVLMGGLVAALGSGCADQAPPCGELPGNQEARDRACTDSSSPQFHLPVSDCDPSLVTATFHPAWCEVGCAAAPSETGSSCANAGNPFSRATVNCQATHTVGGEVGCCISKAKATMDDPVWGAQIDAEHAVDAVMFFACP